MSFLKNISTSFTDAELLSRYKETGNLEALGELYQRYMDLVYGTCLKYVKEPEDARDCVLNIFEELVTKVIRYEIDNFKSWLHQVARNHCLMRIRSEKGRKAVKIDMALMQSEENLHLNGELEKEENFRQLEFCLAQLIAEQRKAIELFYLQGKCYNEIVEMTGMEWNQVRSFIQNGRRNLKICMDKQQQQLTM